MNVISKEFDKK